MGSSLFQVRSAQFNSITVMYAICFNALLSEVHARYSGRLVLDLTDLCINAHFELMMQLALTPENCLLALISALE